MLLSAKQDQHFSRLPYHRPAVAVSVTRNWCNRFWAASICRCTAHIKILVGDQEWEESEAERNSDSVCSVDVEGVRCQWPRWRCGVFRPPCDFTQSHSTLWGGTGDAEHRHTRVPIIRAPSRVRSSQRWNNLLRSAWVTSERSSRLPLMQLSTICCTNWPCYR